MKNTFTLLNRLIVKIEWSDKGLWFIHSSKDECKYFQIFSIAIVEKDIEEERYKAIQFVVLKVCVVLGFV